MSRPDLRPIADAVSSFPSGLTRLVHEAVVEPKTASEALSLLARAGVGLVHLHPHQVEALAHFARLAGSGSEGSGLYKGSGLEAAVVGLSHAVGDLRTRLMALETASGVGGPGHEQTPTQAASGGGA